MSQPTADEEAEEEQFQLLSQRLEMARGSTPITSVPTLTPERRGYYRIVRECRIPPSRRKKLGFGDVGAGRVTLLAKRPWNGGVELVVQRNYLCVSVTNERDFEVREYVRRIPELTLRRYDLLLAALRRDLAEPLSSFTGQPLKPVEPLLDDKVYAALLVVGESMTVSLLAAFILLERTESDLEKDAAIRLDAVENAKARLQRRKILLNVSPPAPTLLREKQFTVEGLPRSKDYVKLIRGRREAVAVQMLNLSLLRNRLSSPGEARLTVLDEPTPSEQAIQHEWFQDDPDMQLVTRLHLPYHVYNPVAKFTRDTVQFIVHAPPVMWHDKINDDYFTAYFQATLTCPNHADIKIQDGNIEYIRDITPQELKEIQA